MTDRYEAYRQKREALKISSSQKRVDKMHKAGKLTAEERIELFFDPGTYIEMKPWTKNRCADFGLNEKDLGNEGVLCGYGNVDGRPVFAYANDVTIMGGSMGEAGRDKIMNGFEKAMEAGYPMISFNDAAGARIQEGVSALHAYCSTFGKTSLASGWIPQISLILGTCAGGTSYCAALTDFIIQVNPIGKMFITGPAVIESVTGEKTTFDAIGGAGVHGRITGLAHFVVNSEQDGFAVARRLLSFLPSNSKEMPPRYAENDPIDRKTPEIKNIIPVDAQKSFDMKEIIRCFVDNRDLWKCRKASRRIW